MALEVQQQKLCRLTMYFQPLGKIFIQKVILAATYFNIRSPRHFVSTKAVVSFFQLGLVLKKKRKQCRLTEICSDTVYLVTLPSHFVRRLRLLVWHVWNCSSCDCTCCLPCAYNMHFRAMKSIIFRLYVLPKEPLSDMHTQASLHITWASPFGPTEQPEPHWRCWGLPFRRYVIN